MENEDLIVPMDDDRVEIPLRMLRGNLETMLENEIPVTGISLKWHDWDGMRSVILVINATPEQKEIQRELGFQTRPTGE